MGVESRSPPPASRRLRLAGEVSSRAAAASCTSALGSVGFHSISLFSPIPFSLPASLFLSNIWHLLLDDLSPAASRLLHPLPSLRPSSKRSPHSPHSPPSVCGFLRRGPTRIHHHDSSRLPGLPRLGLPLFNWNLASSHEFFLPVLSTSPFSFPFLLLPSVFSSTCLPIRGELGWLDFDGALSILPSITEHGRLPDSICPFLFKFSANHSALLGGPRDRGHWVYGVPCANQRHFHRRGSTLFSTSSVVARVFKSRTK